MITGAPLRRQLQLDERAQRGPPLPAIERIVVPLDGSQVAERVLAWAVALGRSFRAELLLVRAYGSGSGLPAGNARWARTRASSRDALTPASRYLARVTNELRNCGVRVATRLLPLPADKAILEVAAHAPVDLILLSVAPHMSGGRACSLGRVADTVVRQTQVPVLLTTALKGSYVLNLDRTPVRALVPLDPAMAGSSALPYAQAFVHALHGSVSGVRRASTADVGEQAEEQDACGSTPVDTYLVAGTTRDEFVDGISRIQGNLIVWGRPHDPAERACWARGAAQLLNSGHRPVLMVP
jgi:nucleotide-binding universal stress UspA family protein